MENVWFMTSMRTEKCWDPAYTSLRAHCPSVLIQQEKRQSFSHCLVGSLLFVIQDTLVYVNSSITTIRECWKENACENTVCQEPCQKSSVHLIWIVHLVFHYIDVHCTHQRPISHPREGHKRALPVEDPVCGMLPPGLMLQPFRLLSEHLNSKRDWPVSHI